MRLVLLALAAALVAAAGAWAEEAPVTATMSTSSTKPVAGLPWRYTLAVHTRGGDPLPARARLEALRRGRLVGCWTGSGFARCAQNPGTWIAFTGRRSGAVVWPTRWVGLELTFRAVVVTGIHTLRLRAPVTVRAAG